MEEWRDIIGYEGLYQVSNLGRVKRLDGIDSRGRLWKGRILKSMSTIWGYLWVPLCKDGVRKQHRIHRLVAEHFIPNVENKSQVNHIDGNKKNNTVENLEWTTHSENTKHAYITGLAHNFKGEKCNLSKLTEKEVIEIYKRAKIGEKLRIIADEFGIAYQSVSAIKLGKTWSWLTEKVENIQ